MTSNTSSSRIAMTIVGLLALTVGIWLYWPDEQDSVPAGLQVVNKDQTEANHKTSPTDSQSQNFAHKKDASDPVGQAELNQASGGAKTDNEASIKDKSESKQMDGIASSDSRSQSATSPQSVQKQSASSDFRVSKGDEYASVPDGRFFTTTGVADLLPDSATSSFRVGQRVYAYAAVQAPRSETVRITWYDSNDQEILPSAYLDVLPNTGSVGYRIFTYRIFRSPGSYLVTASNSTNAVIGQARFEVE